MRNLETLYTKLERGEVKYNSPASYLIKDKGTNNVLAKLKFQKGEINNVLNGILLEDLILICIDQLEHFQNGKFACRENADTLTHLINALNSTRARQYERMLRGVQGTHQK